MNTILKPATSRAKSQQKTRKALLKAGATLIARNGFSGASVRDIASLAGYTQGAFYSNFQSKDDLVFAIMRDMFQQAYETITSAEKSNSTSPADLAQDITTWLNDLCSSNEKAQLETEISLHAMRDEKFALSFYALLDDHSLKMTQILEKIAHERQLELCVPVEKIGKGMIAMARGFNLMMPHRDPKVVSDTLQIFLEAVLQARTKPKVHSKP
ncbi:TetR/AcrR family transcriptional regulator [Pacificibacter marinus]|uniref:HTH-type transcriptional repressor KstR2 n=1 Tax=Pacificibacter marinus TaxID=658057 RepID=A0A1Y5RJE3_9RHOB|nr:TetR/AcrR family transcriptional regulator [Pacificibacter marinus]SEK18241.1 transcriptional regulator, TetR family [Pacificibacter marinus]SLN18915.1 HTH-type transcriptional repressor KstR2 [Pacificibacter marinus]